MACKDCEKNFDQPDLPHYVKVCSSCGREMKINAYNKKKKGLVVPEGGQLVLPSSFLNISLNPLKANGRFFRPGIKAFTELIFRGGWSINIQEIDQIIDENDKKVAEILRNSPLLTHIDFDSPSFGDDSFDFLKDKQNTVEWFAILSDVLNSVVKEAVEKNDIKLALWAMAGFERYRALTLFTEQFEEALWMGQSARRLIDAIRIWDANKTNSVEEFWQQTFQDFSFVLSQVFAVPVMYIQGKAHIGGEDVDGTGRKIVDYLYQNESSNEAILIEIKAPTTKLLKRKYRDDVYLPSDDLAGSVIQVKNYKKKTIKSLENRFQAEKRFDVFNPKCVVIIGNASQELIKPEQRESFELFRSTLQDVEIVTYDELFRKVDILAELFNLKHKS